MGNSASLPLNNDISGTDVGRGDVRRVLPLPQRRSVGEAQEDPRGGAQHMSTGNLTAIFFDQTIALF